jgi:acyl-CoA synthetase (AMP-forming)/AMP-acid ligase II
LSALAERVGWRRFEQAQSAGDGPSPLERLIWPALDWLVARKVRAAFGGRLRLAVAGGAPMPFVVAHFFLAMGVEVLQGYGMTESSPVVSVNRLGRNDPKSVGETLAGVSVKLGDNDELLVRGPNVMQGAIGGGLRTAPRRSIPTAGCTPATRRASSTAASSSRAASRTSSSPRPARKCRRSTSSRRSRPIRCSSR